MGKLKELINIFINPIPEEKSFDELALEAGISQEDLAELKSSDGIDWAKFSREDQEQEEKKKNKKSKTMEKPIQQVQTNIKKGRESEMER